MMALVNYRFVTGRADLALADGPSRDAVVVLENWSVRISSLGQSGNEWEGVFVQRVLLGVLADGW